LPRRLETLLDGLDAFQRRHSTVGVPWAIQKKFSEDRSGDLSALLAYYGFLSFFPLLLVFAAILSFVLQGNPSLKARIISSAEHQFPSLSEYVHVGTTSSNGLALAVGVLFALWGGLAVTYAAQHAMNDVWGVSVLRRPSFVKRIVRGLGLLTLLGGILLATTFLSGLSGAQGPHSGALDALAVVAAFLLNVVLYLLAFQLLTAVHVAWGKLVPGAVVGAALWTALQYLGGYYTRHVVAHATHLYGSFAIVIGMLAWIYLGARVTIYSAQLNVVLTWQLWPRSLRGTELTAADLTAQQWQVDKVDRRAAAWKEGPTRRGEEAARGAVAAEGNVSQP